MPTLYLVQYAHAGWTPEENRLLSVCRSEDSNRVANTMYEHPIEAIYSGVARLPVEHSSCGTVGSIDTQQIVLSTHGNLMALILQSFDPSVDFIFWKSLTMPDVYKLNISQSGKGLMQRLWQEVVAE